MPWTVRDVDRHKKGLSARKKRQWVDVANSVLRKCQREGGSNCEASAIRQANAVVSAHEFVPYTIENNSYTIRTETHQGRTHVVVPVIMMVEGVHNGSHGPLLHLAEDLGRFPAAWNGIPVVIQHPEEGGQYVSANSPEVIDDEKVGTIFNTRMEDGKLKAEAWIDVQRAGRVDPSAMQYIRDGKPLEVSVGVFTDEEAAPGEWYGEQYETIARNHRPDHLALLPGGIGACSWDAGCGVRVNEQEGGEVVDEKIIAAMKLVSIEGIPQINEQGYRELITGIQAKLDGMDDDIKVHYLTEVYEDFFVYEVRGRLDGGPAPAFYKRSYTVEADETIDFTGEAQQVKRKVDYVAVNKGMVRMKNKTKDDKEVKVMEKKQEKVQALIDGCRTGCFTDKSKEGLEALEEAVLDQLLVMQEATNKKLDALEAEAKKKEEKDETVTSMTQEQAIQIMKDQFKDTESVLKILPPEIADQMRHGLKLNDVARSKMIAAIREAQPDGYSEEGLKGKKTEELEMLVKYLGPQVNYGPLGGGDGRSADSVEPMLPPDVEAEIIANEKKQDTA